MVLRREPTNPILTRAALPQFAPPFDDPTSVFNPGAVWFDGRIHLVLRVQSRGRETGLFLASSENGVEFHVDPDPIVLAGLESYPETIYHIYDPRLTSIGDAVLMTVALDTDNGCRMGIARSTDMSRFELIGTTSDADTRNGVLFPAMFDDLYYRLDRPNAPTEPESPNSGNEIWLAESEDLLEWTHIDRVLQGRPHYWDERIGSGPPPVLTEEGWLHIYHGIATHFASANIYQAGAILLETEDPGNVLARSRNNILEPREGYELTGQVPNVVFPSGAVVPGLDAGQFAPRDAELLVYYGAADSGIGLARATVGELIDACEEVS